MKFWRLDHYDGDPAPEATEVGTLIRTAKRGNPASWSSGALGTHFNRETGQWVAARWMECGDPRAEVRP